MYWNLEMCYFFPQLLFLFVFVLFCFVFLASKTVFTSRGKTPKEFNYVIQEDNVENLSICPNLALC